MALSYSITDRLHSDIRTDRDYTKAYTAAVAYVYQTTPKNYTAAGQHQGAGQPVPEDFPANQLHAAALALLVPHRPRPALQRAVPAARAEPRRSAHHRRHRAHVVQKSFFISRIYDLKWDLTKSLIFDYTATNRGVIDEGPGRTIGVSARRPFATAPSCSATCCAAAAPSTSTRWPALTYRLPLDKFPLTDWLSADTRYAATYSWQAASQGQRALINHRHHQAHRYRHREPGQHRQHDSEQRRNQRQRQNRPGEALQQGQVSEHHQQRAGPPGPARAAMPACNFGDANAPARPASPAPPPIPPAKSCAS